MILSWRAIPVLFLAAVPCVSMIAWSADPIALAPEQGLLILQNGEVIEGRITQSGNRYFVTLPGGELRLKAADVAIRCRDLREGYEKKRALLRNPRADEHLELAQWCLQQGLLDEAEFELRQASRLDADHPRIRLIARRLELARAEPENKPLPVVGAPRAANHAELDRRSKQVPPGVMQKFAATVQPLLLNSCAATGCHGVGAKSEFTLTKVRGQGDRARRQTQRNLFAVLEQLDRRLPHESPLLMQPIEPHGGGVTAIFTRQNSRQYHELYEWVRLATGAGERMDLAARRAAPADAPQASGEIAPVTFEEDVPDDASQPDPFDPDEFNREFGAEDAPAEAAEGEVVMESEEETVGTHDPEIGK